MSNRYGLPLQLSTMQDVATAIDKHADNTHYLEVWLDYIDDIDRPALAELAVSYPGRLLMLTRRGNLDEPQTPLKQRLDLLGYLSELDVLIDLDVSSQLEELDHSQSQGVARLIASYHNYRETPESFDHILRTMDTYAPHIYKIATFCNSEDDAAQLIQLKHQLNQTVDRSIVLGMGEHGKITRVVCNQWGNEIVFAPNDLDGASAPGQLTRGQLEAIDQILNGETK